MCGINGTSEMYGVLDLTWILVIMFNLITFFNHAYWHQQFLQP